MSADTRDQVLSIIMDADPFVTTQDIADAAEVTLPTVHRYVDELEAQNPGVRRREVGGADVFWFNLDEAVNSYKFAAGDIRQKFWEEMIHRRAEWLDRKDWYRKKVQEDGAAPRLLPYLWQGAMEYITYADRVWQATLTHTSEDEELKRETEEYKSYEVTAPELRLPDSACISKKRAEWYVHEAPLFNVDWFGDLEGLGYVEVFHIAMKSELLQEQGLNRQEASRVVVEDFDEVLLKEYYPTANDIIATGDTFHEFQGKLYDIGW